MQRRCLLAIHGARQADPPPAVQPRAGATGALPRVPGVHLGWTAAPRPGVQRAEERAGVRAAAPARWSDGACWAACADVARLGDGRHPIPHLRHRKYGLKECLSWPSVENYSSILSFNQA